MLVDALGNHSGSILDQSQDRSLGKVAEEGLLGVGPVEDGIDGSTGHDGSEQVGEDVQDSGREEHLPVFLQEIDVTQVQVGAGGDDGEDVVSGVDESQHQVFSVPSEVLEGCLGEESPEKGSDDEVQTVDELQGSNGGFLPVALVLGEGCHNDGKLRESRNDETPL